MPRPAGCAPATGAGPPGTRGRPRAVRVLAVGAGLRAAPYGVWPAVGGLPAYGSAGGGGWEA